MGPSADGFWLFTGLAMLALGGICVAANRTVQWAGRRVAVWVERRRAVRQAADIAVWSGGPSTGHFASPAADPFAVWNGLRFVPMSGTVNAPRTPPNPLFGWTDQKLDADAASLQRDLYPLQTVAQVRASLKAQIGASPRLLHGAMSGDEWAAATKTSPKPGGVVPFCVGAETLIEAVNRVTAIQSRRETGTEPTWPRPAA